MFSLISELLIVVGSIEIGLKPVRKLCGSGRITFSSFCHIFFLLMLNYNLFKSLSYNFPHTLEYVLRSQQMRIVCRSSLSANRLLLRPTPSLL